ncbi:uncharacterized protein BO96DRAFT_351666 [Aspergillus niger CBS 101883]|nr:uncharacterized protein BO96DRAFT_351666 [Aspergillus niger CBS 101883]PYH50793.1 hypothetical protein BO96DRAFT_351666 [Aspergillus niger CBS 101883]
MLGSDSRASSPATLAYSPTFSLQSARGTGRNSVAAGFFPTSVPPDWVAG